MHRFVRLLLGVGSLVAVVAIARGADRALPARGNFVQRASGEEVLVRRLRQPDPHRLDVGRSLEEFAKEAPPPLPDVGAMPDFTRGGEWLNSPALTRDALRGKVVLVNFWSYLCVNCLNALPHVKALYVKY